MSNYFKIVHFIENFNSKELAEDILHINNDGCEYEITIILDKDDKNKYNLRLLKIDSEIVIGINDDVSFESLEDNLDKLEYTLSCYNIKINDDNKIILIIHSYYDVVDNLYPFVSPLLHYNRKIKNFIDYQNMQLNYDDVAASYLSNFFGNVPIKNLTESALYHYRKDFVGWKFKEIDPETSELCNGFSNWEKESVESSKRCASEVEFYGFELNKEELIELEYAKDNYLFKNEKHWILIEKEVEGYKLPTYVMVNEITLNFS